MFIIVMKILIHICNQIFCPIPIRNTLLLLCLFTNIFRLLLDKIRTRKQVIISKKYLRNLEEKALFLKSITTLSCFLYGCNHGKIR